MLHAVRPSHTMRSSCSSAVSSRLALSLAAAELSGGTVTPARVARPPPDCRRAGGRGRTKRVKK